MPKFIMLLCAASLLLAAPVAGFAVAAHMDKEADKAVVTAYNDGFLDGACQDGEDGFGTPCSAPR